MKLTQLEREIMAAVFFRRDLSIPALSRQLKRREHKVRYALGRLTDQGILLPHVFISPNVLGFTEYQLFVSLATHAAAARKRFIEFVKSWPGVSWFGVVGGPFEFDLMLCVRNIEEVSAFLDTVSTSLKRVSYHKVISAQIRMIYFAPKYLGVKYPVPTLEYGMTKDRYEMDDLDRKILSALVNAHGKPYSSVARELHIPLTTLMSRLKNYKKKEVLKAEGYFINPLSIGLSPYIFLVSLGSATTTRRQKLYQYCLKHPNISYLIENLGAWDYQIGARFLESCYVSVFLDELQQQFEDVIDSVTSIPVFEPLKQEWDPFSE